MNITKPAPAAEQPTGTMPAQSTEMGLCSPLVSPDETLSTMSAAAALAGQLADALKPADAAADAAALAAALSPPVRVDHRGQALSLIKALAAKGDSPRYIAEALRRAGIPTSRGKSSWSYTSVEYIAKANGVQLKGYRTGAPVV